MSTSHWRRLIVPALLFCILVYAALLRLDALFKSYGPYEEPRWLAALQSPVRMAASRLTPDWSWRHIEVPYVGGDPINYLKYGRQMQHFYAAHVREPGFPAATRLALMLTNDHDVGVSIASITFALLALVATYLLGSMMGSPIIGLLAALALAIDARAVIWSVAGWRDEMFAFFAVLSAWAWLRLAQRATSQRAVIAGLVSGGALLTRITSFALLVPPIIFLLARPDRDRLLPQVGLAVAIMLSAIAPFMINCAIATGDPFYAINNHTDFYLKREGVANPAPTSAVAYTFGKFERPLAATDTMVAGIFAYPFNNKWVGLDLWYQGFGQALSWLAIGGLVAWLWQRDGRFLLFMFLGSLIPFSATWTVRGGAEWRLTLFAYSFYLIAAFWLAVMIGRRQFVWPGAKRAAVIALTVVALALAGAAWAFTLPYAIARESLARGEAVMIRAGERDRLMMTDGWSDLTVTENVTARFTTRPVATIRLPLPQARAYRIVLRIDPLHYVNAPPQRVHVALNKHPLATLELAWNPERVGEYTVDVPATAVRPGSNELSLGSERMVPMTKAGNAYPDISRDLEVGLRFWYMLVTPS